MHGVIATIWLRPAGYKSLLLSLFASCDEGRPTVGRTVKPGTGNSSNQSGPIILCSPPCLDSITAQCIIQILLVLHKAKQF